MSPQKADQQLNNQEDLTNGDNSEITDEESKIIDQIHDLRHQLDESYLRLVTIQADTDDKSSEENASTDLTSQEIKDKVHPPPEKRGYLSKWRDRSIGWGGVKWDPRFVVLQHGKLAYYGAHTDPSPRYVLALSNCKVRDDGSKPIIQRSFLGTTTKVEDKHYHCFSIYQIGDNENGDAEMKDGNDSEEESRSDLITPLLRFSTRSLPEKTLWTHLISEHIAYSDLIEYHPNHLLAKSPSAQDRINVQQEDASSLIQTKRGTLPPLIFSSPLRRHNSSVPNTTRTQKSHAVKKSPRTSSYSSYLPSRPMHRNAAPSPLSEDARSQNYRGLLNLGFIILVISNFRLILHSIHMHGNVLMNVHESIGFSDESLYDFPTFQIMIHIFILCSYAIERSLVTSLISEKIGMTMHVLNCAASLIVPSCIIWYFLSSPIIGAMLMMQSIITWMKLISYAHANSDYRTNKHVDSHGSLDALISDLDPRESRLAYPKNVTLKNIYYFWLAPTLTYQIAFPRSGPTRWPKVFTILIRMSICVTLLSFFLGQIFAPALNDLVESLEADEAAKLSVDDIFTFVLKLAIANTYCWLIGSYLFFHLYLNLLAEILQFGDRVFYKDWWNSSDVSSYWRLWNMPVHYWLVRHVYFPSIRRLHISKNTASFIVFFVSAVLHEILISIPFHMIRWWSFLGMMGQIPLVAFTKRIDKYMPGSSIGNMIFWMSFCVVGQPMAVLFYTIDYWTLKSDGKICEIKE
mmetsp:Transcript_5189/g.6345  ORF Transcript_5189/g.6345 Transcript_5189/m.6345 type:complete len:744 (+) Transcript_5189:121-2352(+)